MQWKFPPWHLANETPPPQTFCIRSHIWIIILKTPLGLQKTVLYCFVLGGFLFLFLFFNWGRQWGQSLFFKGGNYVPEIAEREMAGGWQRAGAPGQRSRALLTLDGRPAHCKQLLNRFPTSANVLFGQGSPPPPPLKGSFIICLQKCSTPSLSFFCSLCDSGLPQSQKKNRCVSLM